MSAPARDFSALFVRRPVFAVVVSLLIVIAGIAAFLGVQIRELPDVDRPVVTVRTSYSGAAPETVDTQVTGVIEGAVARVPGLLSVSSSSRFGSSRVTVEFADDVDLNIAANDVRDAVGGVERRLPDAVEAPVIVKADDDGDPIIQLAVTSQGLPVGELTELVEDRVVDRLSAVEGVAEVQVFGDQEQRIRVAVDAAALAARGLAREDLGEALAALARETPAGELRAGGGTLLVRSQAGAASARDVAATYLADGVRVSDVAEVTLAPDDRSTALRIDGQGGIGIGIVRQAQSNTLDISADIRRAVAELNAGLPEGVSITVSSDDAVFIGGAVREVALSLAYATAIVIAVIFAFLRSGRATLVPAVTVPVSIVGTLAAIWLLGFSLNILTLLALVLATGMVVDDAIVVLENIERRRREGMGPRAAAVLGTRQVFFAVTATTATLAAVFVPISFLPGTAGRLFAEFGFVLAIAVTISSFVALTLCPMLASRLLKAPAGAGEGAPGTSARAGGAIARGYAFALAWCLKAPLVVLAACLAFAVFAFGVYRSLPAELTPSEDRGLILLSVSAPQGASLDYTEAKVAEIEAAVRPLVERGEARQVFSIVGRGSVNRAFVTLPLADWSARARSQEAIAAELQEALDGVVGVQVSARTPNSLGIRGGGEGLRFALTGSDYDRIADVAEDFLPAMREAMPGLQAARLSYDTTQPQLSVRLDRERAADLGVSPDSVALALQTVLDGREAGEIHVGEDAITIEMTAAEGAVRDTADLENLFVRSGEGELIALSALAETRETAVAPSLRREGQQRSVSLMAGLEPGYDLDQAVADLEALAAERLPEDVGLLLRGDAAALEETARGVGITFAFALVIILLVLAAQFESFLSAAIIMVTVPFGLGAAALAIALSGGSLNIYSQIGLVMLVGLMAKNGILIVEFANQLRDAGASARAAALEASSVRFRPVMMTMISTVLGGLPLILSAGPGAEAREALGWLVVGGLGFSTLFTLFLTPLAYAGLAGLSRPRASEGARLDGELAAAARATEKRDASV